MNSVKGMNVKNRTYYFFDDMIRIKILTQLKLRWMKNHTKTLAT